MAFMNANPLRLNGPVELTVSLVSRVHDSSTSIDLQGVRVLAPRMPGPHFNAPMKYSLTTFACTYSRNGREA